MDTCAAGITCTRAYTLVHVRCHSSLHVYTRVRVLPLNEAILATVERLQNGVIILLHTPLLTLRHDPGRTVCAITRGHVSTCELNYTYFRIGCAPFVREVPRG